MTGKYILFNSGKCCIKTKIIFCKKHSINMYQLNKILSKSNGVFTLNGKIWHYKAILKNPFKRNYIPNVTGKNGR